MVALKSLYISHIKHALRLMILLYYHLKYEGRTEIVPVLTCTLSLHFAIDMLKWLVCPSKNGPWCQQSISLDKLAIHVKINTAPSLFNMRSKQLNVLNHTAESEVRPVKLVNALEYYYITDYSKNVLLM